MLTSTNHAHNQASTKSMIKHSKTKASKGDKEEWSTKEVDAHNKIVKKHCNTKVEFH